MMIFSDDDLKRLKDHLYRTDHTDMACRFNIVELKALLGRLEAAEIVETVAEKVLKAWDEGSLEGQLWEELNQAAETWRKAKGER